MNKRHLELIQWGLSHYNFSQAASILDIGCGGGITIDLLLQKSCAKVIGMDYSPLCVKMATRKNFKNIRANRAKIDLGNVLNMKYLDNSFDIVTAVETIYFWNPINVALKEVYRVLADGGRFIIINELSKDHQTCDQCKKLEDKLNLKIYTEKELVKHLKDAGFTVANISYKDKWITLEALKK
jgi:ubiquinone/menaquinone biosynthesis C-methylase UbiE